MGLMFGMQFPVIGRGPYSFSEGKNFWSVRHLESKEQIAEKTEIYNSLSSWKYK